MLRSFLSITLAMLLSTSAVLAQDMQLRLGQSMNLATRQLEITSDSLEVDQATGASTFLGNVVASQGEMRLSAQSLRIEYSTSGEGSRQRIDRLVADLHTLLSPVV